MDWISLIRSGVELISADTGDAARTPANERPFGTVNDVANRIPVLGHANGAVHRALGDHEGVNQALNLATRSSVAFASGAVIGGGTEGGFGAIPAAIAAAASYDAAATSVSGRDQGYIAACKNAIENPSASTFLDLGAMLMGDSLAGYLGGQLGKHMSFESSENAKTSALENMNAATNSAKRLKFANEAKTLHEKSNRVKLGTPVFWDDAEFETSVSKTSLIFAVPEHEYVPESNKERIQGSENRSSPERHFLPEQDDALDHDSNVETTVFTDGRKRKEAQAEMYKRDEQKPKRDICKRYPKVRFTTPTKVFAAGPNRDEQKFIQWWWLSLIMPEEFPYTVVAQLNNCYTGLEHSFVRHIQSWETVIPYDFLQVRHRLSPIRMNIDEIAAANKKETAPAAREKLLNKMSLLRREKIKTYNDIRRALTEIEMAIHRFLKKNMTFENYLGRSQNMNSKERLHFQVKTKNTRKVMVIALSEDRFNPTTGDGRPIRILKTAFFESWVDFQSQGLLETKEEMRERREELKFLTYYNS